MMLQTCNILIEDKKEVNLNIIFVVDNLIVITTRRGIWTIGISIKNTRKYQTIN